MIYSALELDLEEPIYQPNSPVRLDLQLLKRALKEPPKNPQRFP